MQIINKNRKNQINSFVDKDHSEMLEFYEILDRDISDDLLLEEMKKLIAKDEDFYDPYLAMADILFFKDEYDQGALVLKEAYERAVTQIVDSQGRWPNEMLWGFLENRHIMRAIENYAQLRWEEDKIDEALDIYRKLLRVNPEDNQGIRFNILAIKMGLNPEEWEMAFEVRQNGKLVGLDGFKTHEWFNKNAKKFPDEFEWFFKLHEQEISD